MTTPPQLDAAPRLDAPARAAASARRRPRAIGPGIRSPAGGGAGVSARRTG